MAITQKRSPQEIARQIIDDNQLELSWADDALGRQKEHIESLIMLGIAAFNDASNQRPENLSEVCRRLGVNLHWVPSDHAPAGPDSYFVYFGHQKPISSFTNEEQTILEIEELLEKYPEVGLWVEAVL